MAVCIRPLRLSPEEADPARCLAIYNTYILHSTATFEEEPLTLAAFTARLRRITAQYPFLVAEENGLMLGYAYLDQYNDRSAYRYTADVSIYLDEAVTAKGIGGSCWRRWNRPPRHRGCARWSPLSPRRTRAACIFTKSTALSARDGWTV